MNVAIKKLGVESAVALYQEAHGTFEIGSKRLNTRSVSGASTPRKSFDNQS